MRNADFLKKVLTKEGIPVFGTCSYAGATPLLPCRAAERIPPAAKTVICCAFPYLVKEKGKRNLCYYACVPDYHKVIGEILGRVCLLLREHYGEEFEFFTDNSPLRETELAARAGIGVLGDNHMLITREYGSYVFLGEIVTTAEFPLTEGEIKECLHCGACRKNCPTGCLAHREFQKSHCLSDITQKKGELSPEEETLIRRQGLMWGCDACQLCCPLNREAKETAIPAFRDGAHHYLTGEEIPERMTLAAFAWRGEKVIRRNVELFQKEL